MILLYICLVCYLVVDFIIFSRNSIVIWQLWKEFSSKLDILAELTIFSGSGSDQPLTVAWWVCIFRPQKVLLVIPFRITIWFLWMSLIFYLFLVISSLILVHPSVIIEWIMTFLVKLDSPSWVLSEGFVALSLPHRSTLFHSKWW